MKRYAKVYTRHGRGRPRQLVSVIDVIKVSVRWKTC